MTDPFERFYDAKTEVYEREGESYGDKGVMKPLGSLVCDLQPYRADTNEKAYGLENDMVYTLYSDNSDLLGNGRYILFGGEYYLIAGVSPRRLGCTAVLRRTRYEDRDYIR